MKLLILAVVFSIVCANYNYGNNVHNGYDRYKGYSYPNSVDRITNKPSLLDFVRNALRNMYLFASNSVSYLSSGVSRVSRQLTVGGPIPPAANVALAVGAIGGKVYMDVVAPAIEAANRPIPAPAPAPTPAPASYSSTTPCTSMCAKNIPTLCGPTCFGCGLYFNGCIHGADGCDSQGNCVCGDGSTSSLTTYCWLKSNRCVNGECVCGNTGARCTGQQQCRDPNGGDDNYVIINAPHLGQNYPLVHDPLDWTCQTV